MEPLIRQMPTWETATNAEIRAFFQEQTSTPISTKWTVGEAIDRIYARLVAAGETTADATTKSQAMVKRLVKALRDSTATDELMDVLFRAFATTPGIRLDTAERQAMLDTFSAAAAWPNVTLAQLKALGVKLSTRWVEFNLPATNVPLPTLAEIGAAVTAMKLFDQKMAASLWVRESYLPAIDAAINAGKTAAQIEGKTIDQLEAMLIP